MANAVKGVFCLLMMITVLSLDETDAFPTGPPVSLGHLCTDMIPQHGRTPQTSPPPYTITASSTCYTPGQVLTGKTMLNCTIIWLFDGTVNASVIESNNYKNRNIISSRLYQRSLSNCKATVATRDVAHKDCGVRMSYGYANI